MACLKDGFIVVVALAPLVMAGLGCAKLTEPPKEEAMQAEPAEPAEPKPVDPTKKTIMAAGSGNKPAEKAPEPEKPAEPPPTNEKLGIKDLVVGKGTEAKAGDTVKVHYVGTLPDGKEFDASKKHGQPFEFELGAGRVIKGWDQGVAGMKIGGKRKLTVPPSLGYGARGMPPVIPPSSTLLFDVELLEVKKK